MRLSSFLAAATLLMVLTVPLVAVDAKKAQYMGGTVNSIPQNAEGPIATNYDDKLVFSYKNGVWDLPYSQITSLEYGQKAGRRVAVAVLISPLALFSKKRNHYLTINYTDEDAKPQAVVFELGKDVVRTALTVIETRAGKKIEFQDDESRKSGIGGQ